MEMVMCRNCGEFVQATLTDGKRVPLRDECPECGGREFKDVHEGRNIDTGADR
jgi:predicted  nucleic acid-binding Zn-ribbon protein